MNRQILDILNQQEQAEESAYQSEMLLLDMIRQDFADSERLLRLFDAFGVGAVQLFQFPDSPALVREAVVPIRTGSVFSIHKHTLCQIPYFHTHDFYELVYVLRGNCMQEFEHLPALLVLREKQACLLRPGIVHSMSKCGSSDVILKFTIPAALFAKAAGNVIGNALDAGICMFQANAPKVDLRVKISIIKSARGQTDPLNGQGPAFPLALAYKPQARLRGFPCGERRRACCAMRNLSLPSWSNQPAL